MLGGFSHISKEDIKSSINFIKEFLEGTNKFGIKIEKKLALGFYKL